MREAHRIGSSYTKLYEKATLNDSCIFAALPDYGWAYCLALV
jgi:hypothetical protein